MRAIILCGGEGKKIWPYSRAWQKSCIPAGNIPNITRIVGQLKEAGISDVYAIASYKEAQVRYFLRNEKDVKIISARSLSETIISAMEGAEDYLVYYGDVYLSNRDLGRLVRRYEEVGSAALVKKLDETHKSTDYICAKCEDGEIKAFYGHPRGSYANAKTAGVFALDKEALGYAAYNPGRFRSVCVGNMPPEEFNLEQCLQTAIEDGKTINGVYIEDNYADIDFPWDILAANEYFCLDYVAGIQKNRLGKNAKISPKADISGNIILGEDSYIGDRVVISGNCRVGRNTVIDNGAIIGANSVIGDNCHIRDYCKISPNTVIGNKNRIGFSAEVTGVTFDNVSIVHNSEVYGVVGESTDIAAGCQMGILRFDDMDNPQKAPVKKYSGKFTNAIFLGDYTRTGIGNLFMPGAKVGSNTALGPGLIVSGDIPENKMVLVEQQVKMIDWGPERYGW